jgi:hypothetical protein
MPLSFMPLAPPLFPQLSGSEEAETWAFLATHFAADARTHLLERLGFADFLPVSGVTFLCAPGFRRRVAHCHRTLAARLQGRVHV